MLRGKRKFLNVLGAGLILVVIFLAVYTVEQNNKRAIDFKDSLLSLEIETISICSYNSKYISNDCEEFSTKKKKYFNSLIKDSVTTLLPSKAKTKLDSVIIFIGKNHEGLEIKKCSRIFQYENLPQQYFLALIASDPECSVIHKTESGYLKLIASKDNGLSL